MLRSIINQDALAALLREHLNTDMRNAAEPIIAKALEDIEREMRAAIVPRLVSLIDRSVDMYRNQDKLVITINQPENPHGR